MPDEQLTDTTTTPHELRALAEAGLPLTGGATYRDDRDLTGEELLRDCGLPVREHEYSHYPDEIRVMREARDRHVAVTRALSEAVGVPLCHSRDLAVTVATAYALGYQDELEDSADSRSPDGQRSLREAGVPTFRHQEIGKDGQVVYSDTLQPVEEDEPEEDEQDSAASLVKKYPELFQRLSAAGWPATNLDDSPREDYDDLDRDEGPSEPVKESAALRALADANCASFYNAEVPTIGEATASGHPVLDAGLHGFRT